MDEFQVHARRWCSWYVQKAMHDCRHTFQGIADAKLYRWKYPFRSTNFYTYHPLLLSLLIFSLSVLIQYWLSPATWASRREKELNLSSSLSRGSYSYANRFDNRYSNLSSLYDLHVTNYPHKSDIRSFFCICWEWLNIISNNTLFV